MDLHLKGKVAVVGGGSSGIGFAIAHRLVTEGAKVLIWARRETLLQEAATRLRAIEGAEVVICAADIKSPEDNLRVIRAAVAAFGRIDILVNNDGAPPKGALLDFDDEAWHQALQQNLMSVGRMSREAVPHLRAAGGGSIINITALSVLQPVAGFGLSVASWAGLLGYAKTLSLEIGPDHITVNTICPGRIDTPLSRRSFTRVAKGDAEKEAAARAKLDLETPVRRIGKPEDVADFVSFLVSPLATFITGTTIPVDGGRSAAI